MIGFLFQGEVMSWAKDELSGIDLGNKKLNKRAVQLLEQLGNQPRASIHGACNGWAEAQGAYRFLANENIKTEDILKPHSLQTVERMKYYPVVLCLQDTTELDFNGQDIEGLGPLSYEAQRGMYLHPTYAVSPEREPLGILDVWKWARKEKNARKKTDTKESVRWIEGYKKLVEVASSLPDTRLVYVADREADIMDFMQQAKSLDTPVDWLIRSQHNRVLPQGKKLWEEVINSKPIGEIEFTLPSRKGCKTRQVKQKIYLKRIIIGSEKKPIEVTCIIAKEIGAPPGVTPVEWRLLTNREMKSLEEAVEIIDWYRARWEIETYFHVLKNGCRIEAMQLSSIEKVERALILYMIVSWRIAHLMRMGRTCPDLPADLFFDKSEWKGAYFLSKKKPPKQTPKLNEIIRLIAGLGGFLGRKGDGEPGVKTLWKGLQRVMDFAIGWYHMQNIENGVGCR